MGSGATEAGLSAEEQAFTEECRRILTERILAAGGWMPFDEYADLCLYHPRRGYYGSWIGGLGHQGDYVTAPEMGEFFNEVVGRKLTRIIAGNGGHYLELGAGSGAFASSLVRLCLEEDRGLRSCSILEVSPALARRQREALGHLQGGPEVRWLESLPESFEGVVFGNELLDAIPCAIFRRKGEDWLLRGVSIKDDDLAWEDRPPPEGAPLPERLGAIEAEDGYLAEVNLRAEALVRSLLEAMSRGVLVLVDYGFSRAEYYHAQRTMGTLMRHRRHMAYPDLLTHPGISDITCHVDFTGVAEAARELGCEILGFCDLSDFLADFPDFGQLRCARAADAKEPNPLAAQMRKLLMPQEMGQVFKVMAIGKGDCIAPSMGRRMRGL